MKGIKIKIIGGAGKIGDHNAISLEHKNVKLLIDFGGGYDESLKPAIPESITHLLLTHAHYDHSGQAPMLYNESGENIPAYMTAETKELSILGWQTHLAISAHNHALPLYSDWQMAKIWENTQVIIPGKSFKIGECNITPHFSSHILGAVGYHIEVAGVKLYFTGDFSMSDTYYPLLMPFDYEPLINNVDYLFMNATYLDAPLAKFEDEAIRFVEEIRRIIRQKRIVLIPSFTIDRPQKLLYVLRQHGLEKFVYIDGGARSAFPIYEKYSRMPFGGAQYLFVNQYTESGRSPEAIMNNPPAIIIASAGTMIPGTASYNWHQRLIKRNDYEIFFPGHIFEGSLAGKLLSARKRSEYSPDYRPELMPANIEKFQFSAHARETEISDLLFKIRPLKVFYLHTLEDRANNYIYNNGYQGSQTVARNKDIIMI